MMNWVNCISAKRTGYSYPSSPSIRSDYIRDYDRLIFSSAFRRLQNKTQVFPLPGSSTFVHNRLTHSLEVASVGRSLGSEIGKFIAVKMQGQNSDAENFYLHDLKGVISAGCLAHDVGNPAFGHSGEKAISNYFIQNEKSENQTSFRSFFTTEEWSDLIDFEGNANALRVLTHQYRGKLEGGLNLTYATLASILKYPCESMAQDKSMIHRKKYGFFQSEKHIFEEITEEVSMYPENKQPLSFLRHPFVYLVEAADDICYRIIDMEDAHRLKILSREKVEALFLNVIIEAQGEDVDIEKIKKTLFLLEDDNESIAYLRAKSISVLVMESADVFKNNIDKIISGDYTSTLMDDVEKKCQKSIEKISIDKIYNHHSVIQVELAGYKVMSGLLDIFVPAILSNDRSIIDKKSLLLLPKQYTVSESDTAYNKVMGVLDYVSGMTDDFAIEMYRRIMGIEIATHSV